MKVEKILFPTDFSEATDSHIPHISADELYTEISGWANKEIDSCCIEEIRGLPNVEKVVLKGIPHEEVINFATEKKIDLIIMGTYGKKGLERFIFGSTAEKVVRNAPCPVLTVRVPEHREK
jgi:universal stress protein A